MVKIAILFISLFIFEKEFKGQALSKVTQSTTEKNHQFQKININ
jgi:hypothetical protein